MGCLCGKKSFKEHFSPLTSRLVCDAKKFYVSVGGSVNSNDHQLHLRVRAIARRRRTQLSVGTPLEIIDFVGKNMHHAYYVIKFIILFYNVLMYFLDSSAFYIWCVLQINIGHRVLYSLNFTAL